MDERYSPEKIAAIAFSLSSLAGLAALLRSKQVICVRSVASALLYSGMIGVTVALLWLQYFKGIDSPYFLLGVSSLAGIGGATALDLIIQLVKHGGIKVVISSNDSDDHKEEEIH